MQHMLIEKAFRYPNKQIQVPTDCDYDVINGYWLIKSTNELLIASELATCLGTKKEDIETGEDQKGE